MALGNVKIYREGAFGAPGAKGFQVAGAAGFPAINPGEPVTKALGQQYVVTCATNKPAVGTDYMAGISMDASTESATVDGSVNVIPVTTGVIYMCAANSAVTITTQAQYNALVGSRVLFSKSAAGNTGIYTVLGTDSTNNGLVIEDLSVTRYPGMIAFSIRNGASYLA